MNFLSRIAAALLSLILSFLSLFTRNRPGVAVPDALAPTHPAVDRLQSYLRIHTDQVTPDYANAQEFLNHTLFTLLPSATINVYEYVSGKPIVLASINGKNKRLPSLLLNSHTDVVPAEEDKWSRDPFDASLVYAEGEWRVYARGAQDMKSIGLQYIEALTQLMEEGWTPERSVHLSYMPDEEIGGLDGMGNFVKSRHFRRLNVGVALDEGLPNPNNTYNVYYGERQTWWLIVRVEGTPGHGAELPEMTASQIAHGIVDKALLFRRRQFEELRAGKDIGDVIGVNIVYTKAGSTDTGHDEERVMNVIPSVVEIGLDIRVPPEVDVDTLDKEIMSWMKCDGDEICPGTTHEWIVKVLIPVVTSRDADKNPYYTMFLNGMRSANIFDRLNHGIFAAATDARYLRDAGVPCFGFSPIVNTPNLLHKHDEYISTDGYMRGIDIYKEIIKHLAGPIPPPTPTTSLSPSPHAATTPEEPVVREGVDGSASSSHPSASDKGQDGVAKPRVSPSTVASVENQSEADEKERVTRTEEQQEQSEANRPTIPAVDVIMDNALDPALDSRASSDPVAQIREDAPPKDDL